MNYYLDPKAIIGNNVVISSGSYISDLAVLGNNINVGPNVTFVDSKFKNSYNKKITVSSGVTIGAGSSLYPGITIGENSIINPGSVVYENIPPNVEVSGNPATIISNIFQYTNTLEVVSVDKIGGVFEVSYKNILDLRGCLTVVEFDSLFPFPVKRLFFISSVPSKKLRGEHAHKECHQMLVLASGSCSVSLSDGKRQAICNLKEAGKSIYIPPMVWAAQYNFSEDAMLIVLASHIYDEKDYIRNFDEYLKGGL